jgi:hypothetical protein
LILGKPRRGQGVRGDEWTSLVEAKAIRVRLDGDNVTIDLDPEIGDAIRKFAGTKPITRLSRES